MADLTGQRLGPFEIKELLGTGGFATVYRAHDPRLRSDVALKILAENHSLDPTIRERFIGEAHALRRVESQSIIEVFDIGETADARPYLVLEFADRGDLVKRRQALANNGWTPGPGDSAAVVEAVTDALDAIHSEMLVHRDVTPSNLLIRSSRRYVERPATSVIEPDERFMLSDMGLVKDLSQGSGLTVGGGTAGFWAPEQRDSLVSVDNRTDIYAASGLLVWFLTGASALTSTDWPHRLAMQGWPASLMTTLQRGMSYSPDGRHPDIRSWRDEVMLSIDQHPSAQRSLGDVASQPTAVLQPEPTPPPAPEPASASAPTAPPQPAATAPQPGAAPTPVEQPLPAAPHVAARAPAAVAAPTEPAPSSNRALLAIGIAVLAIALALGAFFTLRGGELNANAVNRGDGIIAVSTSDAGARLTIVGPATIAVDATETYRFEATGIETVVFIDPGGSQWETDELEVTASSAGRGEVGVVGRLANGSTLSAELTFEAVDE